MLDSSWIQHCLSQNGNGLAEGLFVAVVFAVVVVVELGPSRKPTQQEPFAHLVRCSTQQEPFAYFGQVFLLAQSTKAQAITLMAPAHAALFLQPTTSVAS